MAKHPKRPRDPNQLAHVVVQIATGEAKEVPPANAGKNQAAVELGRKGGLKGGRARAENMTAEQRHAAAQKAAQVRWNEKIKAD